MDIKTLRVIAAESIVNAKLPKDSKLQLLNFVQHEANKHQLMVLMMDGKISEVSESAKPIIENRFDNFKTTVLDEAVLIPLAIVLGTAYVTYKAFKIATSKAYRKCLHSSRGMERKVCMIRAEIAFKTKTLDLVKTKHVNCDLKKDAEKCKAKLNNTIHKLSTQIQELNVKLQKALDKQTKRSSPKRV